MTKNRRGNVFLTIIVLLALALGALYLITRDSDTQDDTDTSTTTPSILVYKDLIKVTEPQRGDKVGNTIEVEGEARGQWYFEASFPIDIVDANNVILAQGFAQAQGEWMTTDYVPFKGKITIPSEAVPQPGASLRIIFHKDNPSGLPENEDSVSLTVVFED